MHEQFLDRYGNSSIMFLYILDNFMENSSKFRILNVKTDPNGV